jgi:hypothetical protein
MAETYSKKNIDLIRIIKKLKVINNDIKNKCEMWKKKFESKNPLANPNVSTNVNKKYDIDLNNFTKLNEGLQTNPNFITIRSCVRLLQNITGVYAKYFYNQG